MAKLENVKVLEMSYGEITHVQYNGKIYERVSAKASVGDLVLVNEGVAEAIEGVESGAFYELYEEDEYGDLVFADDDDDERIYSSWSDELVLFRAIETADKDDKDIEKRVAELERRLAAIEQSERDEENELEIGDYVVPLPESDDEYSVTNTDMYAAKVTDFDNGRILIKIAAHKDEQKVGWECTVKPKYFRKATNEETRWAKIGRKPGEFKKGDIVRVIDSCGGRLVKGGLYEISGHEENTEYVTLDGINWFAEFELVAPVESRVDLD